MSQAPVLAWLSEHRRVASLIAAGVVAFTMMLWGSAELFAPLKPLGGGCDPADQIVKRAVARGEVSISVYNAGAAPGTAKTFGDHFTALGFRVVSVANAPNGVKVSETEIVGSSATNDAARLVRAALGSRALVSANPDLLIGPGVNVFLGPKHGGFAKNPPKRIALATPLVSCA